MNTLHALLHVSVARATPPHSLNVELQTANGKNLFKITMLQMVLAKFLKQRVRCKWTTSALPAQHGAEVLPNQLIVN